MKFTYQELQSHEGEKVGQFKGMSVYAASIHSYTHRYSHADTAYVIYDDGNMLVVIDKAIGRIEANGAIKYFNTPMDYDKYLTTKGLPDLSKSEVEEDVIPAVAADVNVNIDVDVNGLMANIDLSSSELVESLLNGVFAE